MTPKLKSKPFQVNLVELPEWKKRWEPGNAYLSQASDLGWEYLKGMDRDRLRGLLETLAGDAYDPDAESGPREWSPRNVLGPDDLDLITEKIQDDQAGLEATHTALIDAATWMYEAALMPGDSDAYGALESAKEKFEKDKKYDIDWDMWEPLLATGVTAEGIIAEMYAGGVHYMRNQGEYDRYLDFNLELTDAPVELLKFVPNKDRAGVMKAVAGEWKDLSKAFVPYFFRALDKEMEDLDLSNRIDWKKTWEPMLKGLDKAPIQKEMVEYVREARRKGATA